MVILEAMACRKPVVSTQVGSIDELVVPHETGLLVPPGDADALAHALTAVLSDPGRAARMGAAAYERVSSLYPLARCIERTEQYLLSVRRG
jgi:glycosyltransferase involved in cell wall biosynthesis